MNKKYMAAVLGTMVLVVGMICFLVSPAPEPKSDASKSSDTSQSVTITTYNSKHQLEEESFDAPPKRVIAIWQGPIETMLALGLGDRIIAATGIPDTKFLRPELMGDYEKISYRSFESLDQESALAMNPDFIITSWESAFNAKRTGTTDFWHSRNVKTYIGEIPETIAGKRTLEHEYKVILDLGKIFQVEAKAESIVDGMESRLEELQEQAAEMPHKPTVMIAQYMGNKLVNWGDNYL